MYCLSTAKLCNYFPTEILINKYNHLFIKIDVNFAVCCAHELRGIAMLCKIFFHRVYLCCITEWDLIYLTYHFRSDGFNLDFCLHFRDIC